eukprot:jgi/Psemu1/60330/gm1.60330_g
MSKEASELMPLTCHLTDWFVAKQRQVSRRPVEGCDDVFNWIRSGKPDKVEGVDVDEFKDHDEMLPMKKVVGDGEPVSFDNLGSLSISRRSPEERLKDQEDVLNWLRQSKDPSADTPEGEFQMIDQALPSKKGQSPTDRAKEIEGVLDYCRNVGKKPSELDGTDVPFDKIGVLPSSGKSPEDRLKDVDDVFNWIRSGKPDKVEGVDVDEFKAVDQAFPAKKGQSPKDRAKEVEGVLDYCRNVGKKPSELDATDVPFGKIGLLPSSGKSPEGRLKDVDDVFNWIRSGKPDKVEGVDVDEFKIIDEMLPMKKGQSPMDRARSIENALDWRRQSRTVPVVGDGEPVSFDNLGSLSISRRSPEERLKDQENVLNWLRQLKDPSADTPEGEFQMIDQALPSKKGQSPADRAKEIEGVLDYCRNVGKKPSELDGTDVPFDKIGVLPSSSKSPEDRLKDVDDVFNWIRSGKPDKVEGVDVDEFKAVDQAFPAKKGQSPKDRAKEVEGVLDYCRNVGKKPSELDATDVPFDKIGVLPSSSKSPEDRLKDVDDVFNWIRSGKPDKVEGVDVDEFKAVDQAFPAKKGQSPKDRAKEVEGVLDYCRNVGKKPSELDATDVPFDKIGLLPSSSKSPEDRLKDVDDVFNWIRSGKPDKVEGVDVD